MTDQLDRLVNEINSEHNYNVELWVQAIDARLERMRRWGGGTQNERARGKSQVRGVPDTLSTAGSMTASGRPKVSLPNGSFKSKIER